MPVLCVRPSVRLFSLLYARSKKNTTNTGVLFFSYYVIGRDGCGIIGRSGTPVRYELTGVPIATTLYGRAEMTELKCNRCFEKDRMPNKKYCSECCNILRQRIKDRRKFLKLNGFCRDCRVQVLDGKALCQRCRDKAKQARIAYGKSGLCQKCGRFPPVSEGKYLCEVCVENKRRLRRNRKEQGLCHNCGRRPPEKDNNICQQCLDRTKAYRDKYRQEAIQAYGGKCVCCQTDIWQFLQLDHIDGGGTEHRKQIGSNIYSWARKNGYPPTLQLLCASCHFSFSNYGFCPHAPDKNIRAVIRGRRGKPGTTYKISPLIKDE